MTKVRLVLGVLSVSVHSAPQLVIHKGRALQKDTMATKIPAFLDGNTYVHYNEHTGHLIGANSGGLIKVFDPETDSEPTSIDIPENLTSITTHGNKVLITTTAGELASLSISSEPSGDEAFSIIHKCSFPLRDAVFINDSKRSICGGDAPKLFIIDHSEADAISGPTNVTEFDLPAIPTNLSYSALGEVLAVSLDNGNVLILSVINETPTEVHTLENAVLKKSNKSSGIVDFASENSDELLSSKCVWVKNGDLLLVPTEDGSVKLYLRLDWTPQAIYKTDSKLVSFSLSNTHSTVSLLGNDGSVSFFNVKTAEKVSTLETKDISSLAINISWTRNSIYFGTTSGVLYSHAVSIEESEPVISNEVELLFIDEAEDSDPESLLASRASKKHSLDDSNIIDDDDDDDETLNGNGNGYKYYNKSIDNILLSRKKRRHTRDSPAPSTPVTSTDIVPYSPGSTPWIQSSTSSTNNSKRRYLFMSSIGYTWSIINSSSESSDDQTSITVSFFDRSVNKDYHFIDNNNYDLCSMNERGILFGTSGYEEKQKSQRGKISYRHHVSTNDSWERLIPLVKGEYLTSISLTNTADEENGESLIVVGTNLGYLRFFNLYGLCINLLKTSPIVASIASLLDTIFIVHRSGDNSYTYSIINVAEDYSFLQQEKPITLTAGDGPIIKGLFYNEYSDPCIVAGNDDALSILSHWREPNNARWVPILNCKDVVTDYGLVKSKQNWSCWPLGFHEEKFVAMVLKNSDSYPGFPLPLPVDFPIRMPVKCFRSLIERPESEDHEEEVEAKLAKIQEDDPEEEFLRASTFGKLLSSSIADLENDDEQMEKLNGFSVAFDKSLLKLFNNACQSSRLNKAFSIVKLIKNDKALLAATRIGERHNFNNLVVKINKLREDLMELENE